MTVMNVKTADSICVSRNCTQPSQGGTRYKTALCRSCIRRVFNYHHPLHLTCKVCKNVIFIKHFSSTVKIVCSEKCSIIRRAYMNKLRYRAMHPLPVKVVIKSKPKKVNQTIKETQKKTYEKNKGKKIMSNKKYNASNPIRVSIKASEHYVKNKKKLLKYGEEYRLLNKDALIKKRITYYNKNKVSILNKQKLYRLKMRNLNNE